MSAVAFRAWADLRARWRSWAALGVLVGLMAGAVIAAAAGARRTDSAFGRFLTATRAPDVFAFNPPADVTGFAHISLDSYAALPQVVQAVDASNYVVVGPSDATLIASPNPNLGATILGHKILTGRTPRPDRADEAMVSFTMAERRHVGVGDTLALSLSASQAGAPPVPVSFRVVGVEASAVDFPPQTGSGTDQVWTTPAFYRERQGSLAAYETAVIRLRRGGRDIPAFEAEVQKLAAGTPALVFALSDQAVNTQHSIHLQAVALWLLAGLLALAGVLVVAQLLARQGQLESAEHPDLAALGMSRGQLWVVGMSRAVVVGMMAAVVAAATAVALSPLTPVGLARTAEPHPGLAVDALTLGLGVLATVAAVALAGAWPAWRAAAVRADLTPAPSGQGRPSMVAEALSRAGAPVPMTNGVRLALEPGRGRTAVPVRSTLTGAVIGVVALATALGFSASLHHLLATPRLYGVTWDARVTTVAQDDIDGALPAVAGDPDVTDASLGYSGFPVALDAPRSGGRSGPDAPRSGGRSGPGVRVDGIAVAPEKGTTLLPTVIEGRLPTAPGEAVLGRSTMAALHAHVGSIVQGIVAEASTEPEALKVVGRAVFPSLSDAMGLGKGLAITVDGLRAMVPPGNAPPPDTILVRFAAGTDTARATAALQRRIGTGAFLVFSPERPVDLVNFGRVQSLPVVLGGMLGAFALATLAHLLVTSVRRRRRDLAILKSLGLVPRQVRATVGWQSTTLALVAVVVGVPLGLAASRSVWLMFARNLGIEPEPVFPLLALVLLGLATIAVANLVAVLPGRAAARTSPAVVLRSE